MMKQVLQLLGHKSETSFPSPASFLQTRFLICVQYLFSYWNVALSSHEHRKSQAEGQFSNIIFSFFFVFQIASLVWVFGNPSTSLFGIAFEYEVEVI